MAVFVKTTSKHGGKAEFALTATFVGHKSGARALKY